MQEIYVIFQDIEDPRRSNATRHDLHEMLMIALLSTLSGGEGCVDMETFGRMKEPFLRKFMELRHGIPSHDAFSDLFKALDPEGLLNVLLRMARDWAHTLGDWQWTARHYGVRSRRRRSVPRCTWCRRSRPRRA